MMNKKSREDEKETKKRRNNLEQTYKTVRQAGRQAGILHYFKNWMIFLPLDFMLMIYSSERTATVGVTFSFY